MHHITAPSPDDPGPRFATAQRFIDAASQFPDLYECLRSAPARAWGDGRSSRVRSLIYRLIDGDGFYLLIGGLVAADVGALLALVQR